MDCCESVQSKQLDAKFLATAVKLRKRDTKLAIIISTKYHFVLFSPHKSMFECSVSTVLPPVLASPLLLANVQTSCVRCGLCMMHFPSLRMLFQEGKSQWFDGHRLTRVAASCVLISRLWGGNELIFYYWQLSPFMCNNVMLGTGAWKNNFSGLHDQLSFIFLGLINFFSIVKS